MRDWATSAVAQQSAGAYLLELSPARVNWVLRRVTLDSVELATRRDLNARRPAPLPGLHLALRHCTISGVHLFTLIRGGGLVAGSLGCRSGDLLVEIPVRTPGNGAGDSASASRIPGPRTLLDLQRGVRLPSFVPRVRLARLLLPRLAVHLRLARASGPPTPVEIERLEWTLADFVIDPSDTAAAGRFLFSRMIDLGASNLAVYQRGATALRVASLKTSLTDSTLEAGGVGYGPTVSGADFMRSRGTRRDLVRLAARHLAVEGVDYGAFLAGRGVRARRADVDSLSIAVTSDKAMPKDPHATYRTPQQWVADLGVSLRLDSLRVRNGAAIYREHTAGRTGLGVLRFTRLEAAAANLRHVAGRRSAEELTVLTARAFLQDSGLLELRLESPLDAARFDMSFRGTLGAMPADVLNPFIMETRGLRVQRGRVIGVGLEVVVRGGVALGTVTPRYTDLSLSVTRSGSAGILGSGGILGGAARGVASFAAGLAVRADNPERSAGQPSSGVIAHAFRSDETLIQFVWIGLRDGLLRVVRK